MSVNLFACDNPTDSSCEHTYEWLGSEGGHQKVYTCGCEYPDIVELHSDNDGDDKCDVCGWDIKKTDKIESVQLRNILQNLPFEYNVDGLTEKYQFTDAENFYGYCMFDNSEEYCEFLSDVGVPYEGPFDELFEEKVMFCYLRCVSGSAELIPVEYFYNAETNEIERKTVYQPESGSEFPAVVICWCVDLVEVPRDIFERLKDESNKSIISLSSEIESQFDLTDEKIWWNSNTNIDFADDRILIIFKKTTTYPELSIEDFDYENAESIRYLFLRPTDGQYGNAKNYRQIAEIHLKEKGRDKVIEAVRYFERISIILCVQPNYIYGIEEDIKKD